ncbi:TIGR01212 family radical SAM protein [Thiohalomonas denitrificans]|uniref:TIGR01212 family radical SAM protein n=1 Tax=Thiohalomonas denitrificans TaxID=415747 RepID=UPI0026F34636|nr:TIGR01212 family radical SAM protein [Thiohalomonas denitrificans]
MALSDYVNTFGQWLIARYGERVHKVSVDADFTCPNRDGSKGIGGCTFCNNSSFSPNSRPQSVPVPEQLAVGQAVIVRRTRARKFLAYFQAYTNTYAEVEYLKGLYDEALRQPGVIGLSVGTRPDCVPEDVLDLLADYQAQGKEVWLELGLQSAFDSSLERVNRGHGFSEYRETLHAARARGLPVCTHLILGLPGETAWHSRVTLERVLEEGVDGLKLHPLHVVKGTVLANEWRQGEYRPWGFEQYIETAADLIGMTPPEVVYHRVTGTASKKILLAPEWCNWKWRVLNGIEHELARRGTRQGQGGPKQTAGAERA